MNGAQEETRKLYPLRIVERVAEDLAATLSQACLRIEIAGGIRRRKPAVSDIDLVAIPKIERYREKVGEDLFGQVEWAEREHHFLWERLDRFNKEYSQKGKLKRQFLWPLEELETSIKVDLHTCDAQNWGYIFLIRTGSWRFSKHVVTELLKHSLCGAGGRVWHALGPDSEPHGDAIATPEEIDVFRMIGRNKVVPPAERSWT